MLSFGCNCSMRSIVDLYRANIMCFGVKKRIHSSVAFSVLQVIMVDFGGTAMEGLSGELWGIYGLRLVLDHYRYNK